MLIAARHGNIIAMNRVARLYATGRGVKADPVAAMMWNRLASEGGRPDTWLDEFAGKQEADQRTQAEAKAKAFKPQPVKIKN
jgi:hypothetical protein